MRVLLRRWFPGPDRGGTVALRAVSGAQVRRALGGRPPGAAVITASGGAGPAGLTVTSLVAVSSDPPRLSFRVSHGAESWPVLSVARHVGINLLDAATAARAATDVRGGVDPFSAPAGTLAGPWQVPVLGDCVSWLAGSVERRLGVGDHSLVVVRVLRAGRAGPGARPR